MKTPIIHYLFDKTTGLHDSPKDSSGNDIHLLLPSNKGGLLCPEWLNNQGINGSCFRFYGNSHQSQFFYTKNINKILSSSIGAISLWVNLLGIGNVRQCVLSVSNGFLPIKTEVLLEANYAENCFKISIIKDGKELWSLSAPECPLKGLIGNWTHICILQDGIKPELFINGNKANGILRSEIWSLDWFSSLLDAKSPPDRLCIGATSRNYSPFMTLGLFAKLDEITIWDSILSEQEIKTIYNSKGLTINV